MNLGPFTIASTYQYLVVFNSTSGVLQEGDGDILNYTAAKITSTTGNQDVSGIKEFYDRPLVTGEDILSSPNAERIHILNNAAYTSLTPDPETIYLITDPPPDGPFFFNIKTITGGIYALQDVDYTILASAAATIAVPFGSSNFGRVFVAKNIATSGSLTISGSGGCLIDGTGTLSLTGRYQSATLQSDGTNWYRL